MLIPPTFPKIIAYGRSISFRPYKEQKHFVHCLLLCCLPNLPDDWLFILLYSHRLVSTSYMVRPGRMLIIPHSLYKKYFSRVSCISYSLGHFDWDSPASPARRDILSLSCSLTLILSYSLFHLGKNKTNKKKSHLGRFGLLFIPHSLQGGCSQCAQWRIKINLLAMTAERFLFIKILFLHVYH